MKKYVIEFEVKVWLLENDYDRGSIKLVVSSKDSYNALLEAFKILDIENIKFIRKKTIKNYWENDWQKAFDFEFEGVKSIKVNAQPSKAFFLKLTIERCKSLCKIVSKKEVLENDQQRSIRIVKNL